MTSAALIRQIESVLTVVPERCTADEVTVLCPLCGDASGNRSISTRTLLTNCWRCGTGGPLLRWAQKHGIALVLDAESTTAPSFDELKQLLNAAENLDRSVKSTGYVPSVALPTGFTPVEAEPDCAYAKLIRRMAERKHLGWDDVVLARVGFTRARSVWEAYAIFPVMEWDRPVYYQGRTYTDVPGQPTKRFPKKDECPLGSRYWLYGLDELRREGGIAVFAESILNVLSLRAELRRRNLAGVTPLAVFKHTLSQPQITKFLTTAAQAAHPVEEACFLYDRDALTEARRDAEKLSNIFPTSVIAMPEKVDANDDAALAVDLFLQRQPFSRLSRYADLR